MSDLIERLQRWGRTQKLECVPPEKLMDEAAVEIKRLIADRDAWKAAHDIAVSSAYRKRCELQDYIAKLEAFEKSRRKYRNALSELEKDHE